MFNYYIEAIKNYVNFTGRATRTEFWMFILVNFLISIPLQLLIYANPLFGFFDTLYTLFIFLPVLAICVRRYHDCGWVGWWILCPIIRFILLLLPSDKAINRFDKTNI